MCWTINVMAINNQQEGNVGDNLDVAMIIEQNKETSKGGVRKKGNLCAQKHSYRRLRIYKVNVKKEKIS